MSAEPNLKYLIRKISMIIRTGQLVLAHETEFKPSALSSSILKKHLKLIKVLDIRNTPTISLEGMPYFPHLHTFLADSTQISSLTNFRAIRNATKVSFKKTPISSFPRYKLSLLVICGPNLSSIDDGIINQCLKNRSTLYPKIAADLIEKGWNIEWPVPDNQRFQELCQEYGIPYINEEEEIQESSQFDENQNTDNFDLVIQEYHARQERMFYDSEPLFDLLQKRNIDGELAEEIAKLFGQHGIAIDLDDDGIIQAVEDLCKKAYMKVEETPTSLADEENNL